MNYILCDLKCFRGFRVRNMTKHGITFDLVPALWKVFKLSLVLYVLFEVASCSMGAYNQLDSALKSSIP